MRRLVVGLLVLWLSAAQVQAAEITIRLPDDDLRRAVYDLCRWYHCEAAGDQTDAQKLAWALTAKLQPWADLLIQMQSFGHYGGLAALGATLDAHYDAE